MGTEPALGSGPWQEPAVPWGARSAFLLSSALGSRVLCLGAGAPVSGHQWPVVSAGKKTLIRMTQVGKTTSVVDSVQLGLVWEIIRDASFS